MSATWEVGAFLEELWFHLSLLVTAVHIGQGCLLMEEGAGSRQPHPTLQFREDTGPSQRRSDFSVAQAIVRPEAILAAFWTSLQVNRVVRAQGVTVYTAGCPVEGRALLSDLRSARFLAPCVLAAVWWKREGAWGSPCGAAW